MMSRLPSRFMSATTSWVVPCASFTACALPAPSATGDSFFSVKVIFAPSSIDAAVGRSYTAPCMSAALV
jgi:hypothetical protein